MYEYRTARPDDWDELSLLLAEAFNEDISDESSALERLVFEPDRAVLAETRSGELAGVSSAFTRDLVTPGGSVPASHVTMVSVSSMHRRRGILRNMISRLHDDALRRGEPIAVLWASEGRIYQHFGYGYAASRLNMEIDTREVALLPIAAPSGEGTIRKGKLSDVDTLVKVYEHAYRDRPGWSTRDDKWWSYVTADLKENRNGATATRVALHEGPDGVDGYMLWRVKAEWGATPNGIVMVRELVATNPEAYRALWRHAFSVDLTRKATLRFGAVDEPLAYLINEPRALEAKLSDSLWVRILSVPDALRARRYAAPVDVVIEVEDRDIPANARRWRLAGSPDQSICTPTDAPADLRLDCGALAAAYLGGTSLGTLAAGGRAVELTRGTLAPASAAFGWHRSPSAIEMF